MNEPVASDPPSPGTDTCSAVDTGIEASLARAQNTRGTQEPGARSPMDTGVFPSQPLSKSIREQILARWNRLPAWQPAAEGWLQGQASGQIEGSVLGGWMALKKRATVLLRIHRANVPPDTGELSMVLGREVGLYRVSRRASWDLCLVALERVQASVQALKREEDEQARK